MTENLHEADFSEYAIIVNTRERMVSDHKQTYSQIVQLAYPGNADPNTIYTITYRKGENKKPEGIMIEGDSVVVKNGMVFNVTATTKS